MRSTRHVDSQQAAGEQVLELEEPVEDEQGYVYEKFAILSHINKHTRYPGGAVRCPMAGAYAGLPTWECALRILAQATNDLA